MYNNKQNIIMAELNQYPYVIKYFLDQGIDIRRGGIISDPDESIDDELHKRMYRIINEIFPYKLPLI